MGFVSYNQGFVINAFVKMVFSFETILNVGYNGQQETLLEKVDTRNNQGHTWILAAMEQP